MNLAGPDRGRTAPWPRIVVEPAGAATVCGVPAADDVPVQLRLNYQAPSDRVVAQCTLSGLTVVAEPVTGTLETLAQHLRARGVAVRLERGRGVTFSVRELRHVSDDDQLEVRFDAALRLLAAAAASTAAHGPVEVRDNGRMGTSLSWNDGTGRQQVPLPRQLLGVLVAAEIPFVADADTWQTMGALVGLPMRSGTAALNHDGYVEITSPYPQLLESAPVPGLFRLGPTRFGIAARYTPQLLELGSVTWTGPAPQLTSRTVPGPVEALLEPAERDAVAAVADRFDTAGAAIITAACDPLVVVAALDRVDAWPAAVAAPVHRWWEWRRAAEASGRRCAVGDRTADLVLWRPGHGRLPVAAAVVADLCDELATPDRAAVRNVCLTTDLVRVATVRHWPADPEDGCALADVVRPGEFTVDVPLSVRYPRDPVQRAEEHVAAYLVEAPDPLTVTCRRVSVTVTAALAADHRRWLADDPDVAAVGGRDAVTAGPPWTVSAKIAAAVEVAGRAGGPVAYVTGSTRVAHLLRAVLSGRPVTVVDEHTRPPDGVDQVVVCWDRSLPDLSRFHAVVCVDPPPSFGELSVAVRSAALDVGPQLVAYVHAPGTWDDDAAAAAH